MSLTLVYAPYLADHQGVHNLEEFLRRPGIDLPMRVRPFSLERGRCFELGEIFPDDGRRLAARELCREIGYEILEDISENKGWTEAERSEHALGYGNFQKLIVLDRNTPRVSLPVLWCEGTFRDLPWKPLFPKS